MLLELQRSFVLAGEEFDKTAQLCLS